MNFLGQINTPAGLLPEFLGVSIVTAVFAIGLVAFWLVHRVTVPLTHLADAAERLGRNIYAAPLAETGPREVATAAAAFNRMQRRLTRLIEGRTELLAAISHDLRTPITQMRLRTELMRSSPEREKTLAALDEMEAIIATFLDYARASTRSTTRSPLTSRSSTTRGPRTRPRIAAAATSARWSRASARTSRTRALRSPARPRMTWYSVASVWRLSGV